MKSCWNPDPNERPSIAEINDVLVSWYLQSDDVFNKAELKRKELMNLKKLGPEFAKKPRPKAIFTSRPLSSFISKCSSINSLKSSGMYTT